MKVIFLLAIAAAVVLTASAKSVHVHKQEHHSSKFLKISSRNATDATRHYIKI